MVLRPSSAPRLCVESCKEQSSFNLFMSDWRSRSVVLVRPCRRCPDGALRRDLPRSGGSARAVVGRHKPHPLVRRGARAGSLEVPV